MNNAPGYNAAEQALANMASSVAAELANNPYRESMREDDFVKIFLPMFAGLPDAPKEVTPEMWWNVARGPFNEVDIVDDNKQVLFVVPPYINQLSLNPLDGTGKAANMQSITNMLQTARNYASRGSQVMEGYILQEMDNRSFIFNKDADNSTMIERWNAIFARYKLPTIQTTNNTTTPANAANISRDSAEFDPI